jgi:hypothetical protein
MFRISFYYRSKRITENEVWAAVVRNAVGCHEVIAKYSTVVLNVFRFNHCHSVCVCVCVKTQDECY